jgi:hypothetical protein
MKEQLVKLVLRLLANISAEQWRTAIKHVANAAQSALGSVEKKNFVVDALKAQWPKLSDWATNFLTEAAVAFFKNKQ